MLVGSTTREQLNILKACLEIPQNLLTLSHTSSTHEQTLSVHHDVEVGEPSSSLLTNLAHNNNETKLHQGNSDSKMTDKKSGSQPPPYAAISGSHTARRINQHASTHHTNTTHHTNDLIEASKIRARDEV